MAAVTRFLIGAAGVATLIGAAAPAAAQYGGYGRGMGDVILGTVIESVIGGGRYGSGGYGGYDNYGGYGNSGYGNEQALVQRCARAAEQRASGRSASGYGYDDSRYGDSRYGDNRYGYANSARVVGITSVERRRDRSLRIKGVIDADSGYNQDRYGNSGYGGYGTNRYGASSSADLRFQCNIDYRGRITNLDLNRNDRRYGY